ncbi:MAG: SEC-C metal-binding domain-containing protein [Candidatus Bathyarchaeota archaeon]|nr:SEC-C metal-binding domain-containing protein [Candidatus Bathyarchaeota archaeon]MDH5732576.1 SEC-C metal-binding domain-containing protein [Candidatus Bathyarchaeota archaeon]
MSCGCGKKAESKPDDPCGCGSGKKYKDCCAK